MRSVLISKWESEQGTSVLCCLGLPKGAAKDALKRLHLVCIVPQQILPLLHKIKPNAWFTMRYKALKIPTVRIEHGYPVAADKAGNICQLVCGTETNTESTDFGWVIFLSSTSKFTDVVKVTVTENTVIVGIQCWALPVFHVFAEKVACVGRVLSPVEEELDLCCTSIISILNELFKHINVVLVVFDDSSQAPCQRFMLAFLLKAYLERLRSSNSA